VNKGRVFSYSLFLWRVGSGEREGKEEWGSPP